MLNDNEVKARTDAVIKMSNVTGDAASDVSSYMTAIWNNFAKGSTDLEHFADVITALGASTASSSSEIAQGLSKFASIGDTIGLSYDYATSILASLVANTRQSADVIGTALRSIFARLQGLNLGETLEDGVDLNKYSIALQKVGVQILDTNGEMKSANEILDQTAEKWGSLTKAQQTALAQTVAGTRQYAQFVAMMENWGDVQENLDTAATSDGTLQKQADIYAESWEAARDRVKAAAQDIYDSILDDRFFIEVNNGIAVALNSLSSFVDTMGGMKGVVTTVGSLLLTMYARQLPEALNNLKQNFRVLTGQATQDMVALQGSTREYLESFKVNENNINALDVQANNYAIIAKMQSELIANSKNMTAAERESYQIRIKNTELMLTEVNRLAEIAEKGQAAAAKSSLDMRRSAIENAAYLASEDQEHQKEAEESKLQEKIDNALKKRDNSKSSLDWEKFDRQADYYLEKLIEIDDKYEEITNSYTKFKDTLQEALKDEQGNDILVNGKKFDVDSFKSGANGELTKDSKDALNAGLENVKKQYRESAEAAAKYVALIDQVESAEKKENQTTKDLVATIRSLKEAWMQASGGNAKDFAKKFGKVSGANKEELQGIIDKVSGEAYSKYDEFQDKRDKSGNALDILTGGNAEGFKDNIMNLTEQIEAYKSALQKAKDTAEKKITINVSNVEALTRATSSLMLMANTLSSLRNLSKSLADDQTSGFEKLASLASFAASGMMAYKTAVSAVMAIENSSIGVTGAKILAETAKNKIEQANIVTQGASAAATGANSKSVILNTAVKIANMEATKLATVASIGFMGAMAGLAIAAVAVVAVYKQIQANSPEGKLKEAKKAAEESSKAFEEAKSSAQELENAFKGYESIADKLNNCTIGTQEWRDALKQVNEQALDLVQKIPELEKALQFNNKTNTWELNQDTVKELLDQRQLAAGQAQISSIVNQGRVSDAELNIARQNLAERINNKISYTDYGSAISDRSNNVVEVSAIGGLIKKNLEQFTGNTRVDRETLKEILGQNWDIDWDKQAAAFDALVDALGSFNSDLKSYTDQLEQREVNRQKENELAIRNNLAGMGLDKSRNAEVIFSNLAKMQYNELYAEQQEIQKRNAYDNAQNYIAIHPELEDSKTNSKGDITDSDDKVLVSASLILAEATAEALQPKLEAAAKSLDTVANNIRETQDTTDDVLLGFLKNGNLDDATRGQALALKNSLSVDSLAAIGIDSKTVGDLGFKTVQELIDAINDAVDQQNFDTLKQSFLRQTQKAFEEIGDGDHLSLAATKALGGILDKAFAKGFDLTGAFKNIKSEDKEAFINTLASVNWPIATLEEVNKALADANVEASLTAEGFNSLSKALNNSELGIKSVTEKYKALHGVIDGLSDWGKISADTYDKLGNKYSEYFQLMLDGSYQLVGKAEDLKEALKQDQITELRNTRSGYNDDITKYQNYINNSQGLENTKDEEQLGRKISLIKDLNDGNVELAKSIEEWQSALADDDLSSSQIEKINQTILKLGGNAKKQLETAQAELLQTELQIALSATSLKELKELTDREGLSATAYNTAAYRLDQQQDVSMLDANELKNYAEYLQEASSAMEGFNKEMSKEQATIVAKGIMKMNDAIDTLSSKFVSAEKNADSWYDILKKSTKGSEEYAEAMIGTRKAVAELLDVSEDYVNSGFIEGHLEAIQEAASGSEEAIDNLKAELSEEIVAKIIVDNAEFITNADLVNEEVQTLKNAVAEMSDLSIGAPATDEFVRGMNALIESTHMTVDQVNALADSMGFEVAWSKNKVVTPERMPVTSKHMERSNIEYNDKGEIVSYDEKETVSTDYVTNDGSYTVFAMDVAADGKSPAPKISGATKKANASANNYSSKNAGGKKPGKSGGGGGGSKKKEEKPQDSELDVYHNVNRAIKRVTDSLDRLDKRQSHLYGAQLINSLKAENVLLEQQAKNYEELGKIIDSELGRLQGDLGAYGVTFDTVTGEMLNYTDAYLKALETYNKAIDTFNTSAQSEADQQALTNAKETYDEFKKLLSEYDSTLDKQIENEKNKLDIVYKEIENTFKAWETQIKVTLDLSSAQQEWQKFWQKVDKNIKTTIKDYAREIGNISDNFDLSSNDIGTDIKAVEDIKRDIDLFRQHSGDADFHTDKFVSESEAANALLEYSNTLRSDAENLYNLYTDAWDEYLDGVDDVVGKWSDLIKKFDEINDSLEHNAKVIELLYGDTDAAARMNDRIYDVANTNNLVRMDSLRQSIEALEREREELLAQGAEETDQDVKKLTDAISENQKAMESAIESYLQGLTDQFKNSVKIAMTEMEKGLAGGSSYSSVSQRWQDAQYAAKGYYDDLEKIYQLETLENKWQNAINSSSTLKNQQKLNDLMNQQLNDLESKTKLTEYDIQLAEKQLAVAQAQAALEDAQNNKNSMKLVRNEQGNWAYQYVTDDEDVADKQQALMDANHEWYEFTKQSWQDLTEEIWGDIQTAQERLTALMEEYNTADTARREEIKAEYDYLYNYYYGLDGLIATKAKQAADIQTDVNAAMMNDLWALYLMDEENYDNMTEAEKALVEQLKEHSINQYELLRDAVSGNGGIYDQMADKCEEVNKESISEWTTTASTIVKSWATNPDSVQKTVEKAYDACINAQRKFDAAVEQGISASGVQYDNLGQQLDVVSDKINDARDATEDLVNETSNIDVMRQAVEALGDQWNAVADQIREATSELEDYLRILRQADAEESRQQQRSIAKANTLAEKPITASGGNGGSGSGGGGRSNNYPSSTSDASGGRVSINYSKTFSGNSTGQIIAPNQDSADSNYRFLNSSGGKYMVQKKNMDGSWSLLGWTSTKKWTDIGKYQRFDTGGYTGNWNDGSGKVAMLHSKELVLNADDTENMLQAVKAVRSISSIGSSVAASVANGVANMVSGLLGISKSNISNVNANTSTNSSNNTFNVTMEVDGGNVEEIKEAIMSLPTLASQYLSQKKL